MPRRDLEHWHRFIRASTHILRVRPAALFQQAANLPDGSPPARVARERLERGLERQPWLSWLNKTQDTSRCLLTLAGHRAPIWGCAITADGTRILSASAARAGGGEVRVWDAVRGEELATLGTSGAQEFALDPAGGRVAWAATISAVSVLDTLTGATLRAFHPGGGDSRAPILAFSPDGARLAFVFGSVRIWDLATGDEVATFRVPGRNPVYKCAFSPDGRALLLGTWQDLTLCDLATGEVTATLPGHTDQVVGCAFSPDGARIVSACADRTLKLWDAASGRELATWEGHQRAVRACAFSPDGRVVVSASADLSLKLWDAERGTELGSLIGHGGAVTACCFAPDGRTIVSGSDDGTLKLWDAVQHNPQQPPPPRHTGRVNAVCYAPDGARIATASEDATLAVWEAGSGRRLARLEGHRNPVTTCAFAPDGSWLVSGSDDHHLLAWDPATGQQLGEVGLHGHKVLSCGVSPDGARVISASRDRSLRLWAPGAPDRLEELAGDDGALPWAFSPDGGRVLAGSSDGTLHLADAATGKALSSFPAHRRPVLACAWSPLPGLVASVALLTLRLWHVPHGSPVLSLGLGDDGGGGLDLMATGFQVTRDMAQGRTVAACCFSPDGRRVVAAWGTATPLLADLAGGRAQMLVGHTRRVTTCRFSVDGQRVMTAGEDGMLWVWDAATGNPLAAYEPELRVTAADLAPDGMACGAGTAGGELHLLRLANLTPGPSIVTLLEDRPGLGARLRLKRTRYCFSCPSCRAWFEVRKAVLGQNSECPKCRAKLQFNAFTVQQRWTQRARTG